MFVVRLRLEDPAGRTPKGVLVEQRMEDGSYRKLGEVRDAAKVKIETIDSGDLLHHLRVTTEWSDGLVSVADDVFVGENKKIAIQPDPSIKAPRHTLPAMSLVQDALTNMHEPLQRSEPTPAAAEYGGEVIDKAKVGFLSLVIGFLSGALTVALWGFSRKAESSTDA